MEIIIRGKDNCLCYKAAEFKIEKGQEIVVSNGIVAYSYIDGRFDARMVAGRQLPWDKSFLKENKNKTMTVYSIVNKKFEVPFGFGGSGLGKIKNAFGSYTLSIQSMMNFIKYFEISTEGLNEEYFVDLLNSLVKKYLADADVDTLEVKLTNGINEVIAPMGLSLENLNILGAKSLE